jgi:hypothetical protein
VTKLRHPKSQPGIPAQESLQANLHKSAGNKSHKSRAGLVLVGGGRAWSVGGGGVGRSGPVLSCFAALRTWRSYIKTIRAVCVRSDGACDQ